MQFRKTGHQKEEILYGKLPELDTVLLQIPLGMIGLGYWC